MEKTTMEDWRYGSTWRSHTPSLCGWSFINGCDLTTCNHAWCCEHTYIHLMLWSPSSLSDYTQSQHISWDFKSAAIIVILLVKVYFLYLNDLISLDDSFNVPSLNWPILLSRLLGGLSRQNPLLKLLIILIMNYFGVVTGRACKNLIISELTNLTTNDMNRYRNVHWSIILYCIYWSTYCTNLT